MYRIIICIALFAIVFGCGRSHRGEVEILTPQEKGKYFIELKVLQDKAEAINFEKNINIVDEDLIRLFIDSVKEKEVYKICLGPFNSSYSAGERAYKLFSINLINDYKIIKNFQQVYDEFSNLIIVGNYKGFSSLYNYNFKSESVELFWRKYGEKVIDLVNNKDTCIAFFITAQKTDRKGIFPDINEIKLYKLDLFWSKIEFLSDLKNAIQISTGWENINSFKIILNSFDYKISTFVNQRTIIYNTNGKVIANTYKTFDLVKENFPQLPGRINKMNSSDNKYTFIDSTVAGRSDYYLKTISKKHFIFSSEQSLNDIEWVDDKFLVFSTSDILPSNKSIFSNSPQTSTLTVYDIKNKKILSQWRNDGMKNFIIKSDYLLFDDGFGKKSRIFIYDLSTREMKDTISIEGGCGIRNIPYFPKFN